MARHLVDNVAQPSPRPTATTISAAVLRWSGMLLVATVWSSATLFGLYILAFYAGAFRRRLPRRSACDRGLRAG